MNDIDPAKMTEAERKILFTSFTQGMTPALPQRQTLARLLAPWLSAIRAQRGAGYDWKQIAEVCATNLKIKVSARTLERVMGAATGSANARRKARQRTAESSAIAPATPLPTSRPPSA